MKKIILLFILISQISWSQSVFDKANDLYKKGNYEEAIISYESILKSKKHSAELYFNIGNCYYKLQNVAPAIYNYEKALLLNPDNKEIATNLKFAHKLQIDDIRAVQKVGFSKIIHDFTSKYDYDTWAKIVIGFAFLFLLLFFGYYFSGSILGKRLFFIGMSIALIFVVLSFLSANFEKSKYDNDNPAIVFDETLSVKTEPKTTASDVVVIHAGTKVLVLETLDNWKKIQLPNETKGWVLNESIKSIK